VVAPSPLRRHCSACGGGLLSRSAAAAVVAFALLFGTGTWRAAKRKMCCP